MKKIETYGHPIDLDSLIDTANAAGGYPKNSGYHDEIYYSKIDGKVWYASLSDDSDYTPAPGNVFVGCISDWHLSAQHIMDIIHRALTDTVESACERLGVEL